MSGPGSEQVCTILHVVDLPVANPWLNGVATHHDRSRYRHVVASLGPRTSLHDALEERHVDAYALGATSRRDYPAAVLELARLLRRERVQIVQTHLFDPSVVGLVAAALARTPVKIVTRHHSDFTTTFDHPWHRRLDRLQALYADHVLAASAAVKRDMMRYERVPDRKITVARYGYDFSVLRPVLSEAERTSLRATIGDDGDVLLVTVARLSESKGHRYLFDAAPRILEAEPRARFVLVGTGPMRDEMEADVRRHGIAERVSFLGWRDDAARLMEAADLVVHPTLHEAFCSVIIEAMALARPLVATDIAAAPEQIDDGESGLLVPARDPDALAAAVTKLLGDPAFAADLGREAQRRVNERFAFPKMMALYESIYERLRPQC